MISPKLEQQLLEAHGRLFAQPRWQRTARRAFRPLRLTPGLGIAVVPVGLVVALGAVSAEPEVGRSAADRPPAPPAQVAPDEWGEPRRPDEATMSQLRTNFGVFRREQTSEDKLPRRRDTTRPAVAPDLSRLALTRGSVRVYLGVAGHDRGTEICAFAFVNASGAGSSNCMTVGAAKDPLSRAFSSVDAGDGDHAQLLFRVVPDSVTSASFAFGDGERVTVEPENNVLVSLDEALPRSAELYERGGAAGAVPLTDLR